MPAPRHPLLQGALDRLLAADGRGEAELSPGLTRFLAEIDGALAAAADERDAALRALGERALLGLALLDLEGQLVDVDPGLARLLGFADPAALRAAGPLITPASWSRLRAALVADGQVAGAVVVARDAAGGERWLAVNAAALAGPRERVAAIFQDVTDVHLRREHAQDSANKLLYHLKNTPLGVIEWNLDFEVVEWNQAAEEIFGYPRDEALGRHAAGLLIPAEARPHVDAIWRGLLSRSGGTRSTNENFTKHGRSIMCEWYNTTLVGADGEVTGVVSLVADISQTKALEAELQRAKARSEAANQAKSAFLAAMSHELRTPLNAIIGYSELLAEEASDRGDPGLVADTARILGAGRHLLRLISDVLDLSKIEAGKMEVVLEEVDVCALIRECVDTVRPLVAATVRLELGCPQRLDARTDPGKVRQILLNLLSNAAKFTSVGVIRVTAARAEGALVLSVEDTGIGIPRGKQDRLFRPFSRIDEPGMDPREGTGLGLSLVGRYSELLGGRVEVESEPGVGSRFTVHLPAEEPPRAPPTPW